MISLVGFTLVSKEESNIENIVKETVSTSDHQAVVIHRRHQGRLHLVETVRSPAAHLAARIGLEGEPPRLAARHIELRVVRNGLGATTPHIPIKSGRNRFGRQVAIEWARIVHHDDLLDFPQSALANELAAGLVGGH